LAVGPMTYVEFLASVRVVPVTGPLPHLCAEDRFRSKVGISRGRNSCWVWGAGCFDSGYGAFYLNGRTRRAHVVAYMMWAGPIPSGKLVTHTCDNPPCVRPEHLKLGTWQSNMDDKVSRGRESHVRGHHKLSEAQVAEIKRGLAAGVKVGVLAASRQISEGTIRLIKRGLIWRSVAP